MSSFGLKYSFQTRFYLVFNTNSMEIITHVPERFVMMRVSGTLDSSVLPDSRTLRG